MFIGYVFPKKKSLRPSIIVAPPITSSRVVLVVLVLVLWSWVWFSGNRHSGKQLRLLRPPPEPQKPVPASQGPPPHSLLADTYRNPKEYQE